MDPSSSFNKKRKPTEPPCSSSKNAKEDDDRKHNHQNILHFLDRLKEGLGIDLFQQYCEGFRKRFVSQTPASEESHAPSKDHLNFVQDFEIEYHKLDETNVRLAAILLMLGSRNLSEDEVQRIFDMFDILVLERFNVCEEYLYYECPKDYLDYVRLKEMYIDYECSKEYLDYMRLKEKYFHDRTNMFDAMYEEANRIFSGHDDLIYVFKHMIEFGFANRELVLNPVVLPEATDLHTNVLNLIRDASLFISDQEGENQDDNIDLNDFLNEARMECLTKEFKKDPYFPITEMSRKDAKIDLKDMVRRLRKKLQNIDRG